MASSFFPFSRGLRPDLTREKIHIYIAPSPAEFHDLTKGRIPDWGVACAFPPENRIILKSPRTSEVWKEDIGTILRHELLHIYVWRIAPGKIPRWFDEGIAIAFSGEWDLWSNMDLAVEVFSGNLIPLEEMRDAYPEGERRARLFYLQSYSTISFLISKIGKEGFRVFLHRILASGSFETALHEEAHMSLREFEKEWKDWLAGSYHPLTLLLRREVLFAFALVALLIAYIVRKRRFRREIIEMQQREKMIEQDGDPSA